MRKTYRLTVALVAMFALSACAVDTIVHNLDEREANAIMVLLAEQGIVANKIVVDTGREVNYHIAVPGTDRIKAMRVLHSNSYPRAKSETRGSVYAEGGLIPTSSAEKQKELAALEGEIERQLMLVDGILEAQVNLAMPDETALRTAEEPVSPTKASVAVKYRFTEQGTMPLGEDDIKKIIAAGVEKLDHDNVTVVATPARQLTRPDGPGAGTCEGPLGCLPAKTQKIALFLAIGLIIFLLIALLFQNARTRSVRARLIRLQNEIAKARRKSGDSLPAPQ